MHLLFAIDELSRVIFSYMPLRELAVSARVSSTWFQFAVPFLYSEINILHGLSLLGRVVLELDHDFLPFNYFENGISDQDWMRFLKYAPHVRILHVYDNYNLLVEAAILHSATKGVPYLFPNTRQLRFFVERSELGALGGLVTPKIDQLHIHADYHPHFIQEVFDLTMERLPALRVLRMPSSETKHARSLRLPVHNILTFFASTLTSVYIPFYLNTAPIVKCLSKIPNLDNLVIGWEPSNEGDGDGDEDEDDIAYRTMLTSYCQYIPDDKPIAPYEGQKAIMPLRSFSFVGKRQSLLDNFFNAYNLTSLLVFTWAVDISTYDNDLDIFVWTIVSTCPRLQSLTLGRLDKPTEWRSNFCPPRVPWLSIRPIHLCKELTKLVVYCVHIEITLEEFTQFLKGGAAWTHLNLFTSPYLRLQDMLLFAEHCPNLRHLGITLDAQPGYHLKDLPPNYPTFPVLTSIHFGLSTFEMYSGYELGSFLRGICKKPPYISVGYKEMAPQAPLSLQTLTPWSHALYLQTVHYASKVIARIYISEELSTGEPMSMEAREYVRRIREQEELSESSEEASYSESEDSEEEEGEEELQVEEEEDVYNEEEYDEENDSDYVDDSEQEDNGSVHT